MPESGIPVLLSRYGIAVSGSSLAKDMMAVSRFVPRLIARYEPSDERPLCPFILEYWATPEEHEHIWDWPMDVEIQPCSS